jgi:aminoglycoside 6'-N-acetyltransferase
MARDYGFRAMSAADLSLVRNWLETPEVMRWWGQPDQQHALVSGDLDHPDMDQFIVSVAGRPFGHMQCYALSTWNQGFGAQPPATRGIDQFIGEPEMIGLGHGSGFIRQLVEGLLRSGTLSVVTDPDPAKCKRGACLRKGRVQAGPDG